MENNYSRLLPIKSCYNFRDLGGYVGAGGKSVVWRKFIRSGDFLNMSKEDVDYLASIPIRTIVDFRDKSEVEKIPDLEIRTVSHNYKLHVKSGNLIPDFMLLVKQQLDDVEFISKGKDLMKGLYIDLVENNTDIYKEFFSIIQRSEVPLLFHCTAGKDRTGMAAALLLCSLGVDKKTVYEDYLLTNRYLSGKYKDVLEFQNLRRFVEEVEVEYLETAFRWIESSYGSIENFLVDKLSVDIKRIQSMYLE